MCYESVLEANGSVLLLITIIVIIVITIIVHLCSINTIGKFIT